jgi:hypothetical protein
MVWVSQAMVTEVGVIERYNARKTVIAQVMGVRACDRGMIKPVAVHAKGAMGEGHGGGASLALFMVPRAG